VFIAFAIEPGELLDRLTILELRNARAVSEEQRRSAGAALARARAAWAAAAIDEAPLEQLIGELRPVNQSLWQAEDEIRRHEVRPDARFRWRRHLPCREERIHDPAPGNGTVAGCAR